MKILLFIAIGFIAGYIVKDLLTKESEIIYNIKKLRAKKGGEVSVETDTVISNPRREQKDKGSKRKLRIKARKNK